MVSRKRLRRMAMAAVAPPTSSSSKISDWAGLPNNVLDLILDKVVSLGDYIRFGAVCSIWHTVALEDRNHRNRSTNYYRRRSRSGNHQLPMLMIPPSPPQIQIPNQQQKQNTDTHSNSLLRCRFYSVTRQQVLDFQLPVPYRRRFLGSSFGWLISVDSNFAFTLFNPFSSNKSLPNTIMVVPPIPAKGADKYRKFAVFNHECLIAKAILSAEPTLNPHECILMIIYGPLRTLGFIGPGLNKQRWFEVKGYLTKEGTVEISDDLQGFCDVIYSTNKGLFYALQKSGQVLSLKVNLVNNKGCNDVHQYCEAFAARIGSSLKTERPYELSYVVETCEGHLLQVLRFGEQDKFTNEYLTREFKVFKFHQGASEDWIELKSLGDHVLFLGDNASLSVLASDFPGCTRGAIYYSLGFRPELRVLQQPYLFCAP